MSMYFSESAFDKRCVQDKLYQVSIDELSLLTSMHACYYSK